MNRKLLLFGTITGGVGGLVFGIITTNFFLDRLLISGMNGVLGGLLLGYFLVAIVNFEAENRSKRKYRLHLIRGLIVFIILGGLLGWVSYSTQILITWNAWEGLDEELIGIEEYDNAIVIITETSPNFIETDDCSNKMLFRRFYPLWDGFITDDSECFSEPSESSSFPSIENNQKNTCKLSWVQSVKGAPEVVECIKFNEQHEICQEDCVHGTTIVLDRDGVFWDWTQRQSVSESIILGAIFGGFIGVSYIALRFNYRNRLGTSKN